MQARFDTCLRNLRTKQDKIIKRQIINNAGNSFFPKSNNKQLDFLDNYLLNYKLNTFKLIDENPENKLFYEAHFNAVVELLEKLESKNELSELKDEDYTLVVDVKYNLNSDEIGEYTNHFALIGSIIGCSIGFLIWTICLLTASLPFPPLALLIFPVMLGYLVSFLSAGAAVGALIGVVVGECIVPFVSTPLAGNPYGDAFDISLLKDAYPFITEDQENQYSERVNI